MLKHRLPDRQEQIAFMTNAPERMSGYVKSYLSDPQVKKALYRHCEPESALPRKLLKHSAA